MSKRKPKVSYSLDGSGISDLTENEIKAILRAADELIATGGRSMLTKILKGSKDKKVLEYGLDKCPVYGFYKHLTLSEITKRIDWTIENGYLEIEYSGQLPVIVFSESGWEIERETYAEELFQKLQNLIYSEDFSFVSELKDRNRGMILLLIEKVKKTGNSGFIPLLKGWQQIENKKVCAVLNDAIDQLENTK